MTAQDKIQPRELKILREHGIGACVRVMVTSRKITQVAARKLIDEHRSVVAWADQDQA